MEEPDEVLIRGQSDGALYEVRSDLWSSEEKTNKRIG